MGFLSEFFKLKEHNTTVKTEVSAGITTFMTMAYILAVNPSILSAAMGAENYGAIFTATAVAAVIGTLCMAFLANYPFALAPGMGLNAFFAFSVVIGMGISWEVALTAVLVEGIVFLVMSLFNVREAIFDAIPTNLKHAVGVGIGLFIAFIGFQNANIVLSDGSTKVTMFELHKMNMLYPVAEGAAPLYNFNNVGITVILAIVGVLVTAVLVAKKAKGAILLGILVTYLLGLVCEIAGIYIPLVDGPVAFYSLIPDFSNGLMPPSMAPIAFKFDFSMIATAEFFTIVFAFLFVDLFDTLGTLIGVSSKAGFLDKEGKLPKVKGALLADAIATTAGACLGTSTTTTYVESAAGVAEGGRTGLTAVTTAILFGAALFLSPIFLVIPAFATAPALIVVGFYMMGAVTKIDFDSPEQGIPAFLALSGMAFTYSISEGIVFGVVSYVVINAAIGAWKNLNFMIVVVAILFIGKYLVPGTYFLTFTVIVIAAAIAIYHIGFKKKKKA